jgi:Na+-transporting methylmalonyl-CoA/oxaloacetate decarboxylase beta subunit
MVATTQNVGNFHSQGVMNTNLKTDMMILMEKLILYQTLQNHHLKLLMVSIQLKQEKVVSQHPVNCCFAVVVNNVGRPLNLLTKKGFHILFVA